MLKKGIHVEMWLCIQRLQRLVCSGLFLLSLNILMYSPFPLPIHFSPSFFSSPSYLLLLSFIFIFPFHLLIPPFCLFFLNNFTYFLLQPYPIFLCLFMFIFSSFIIFFSIFFLLALLFFFIFLNIFPLSFSLVFKDEKKCKKEPWTEKQKAVTHICLYS